MLTGSLAFADSTQIEVTLKNLKYMFDGKEVKQQDGQQSIVYDGTTYVPIRFVSEALGKQVTWDGENDTIWIGKTPNAVVAEYTGGQVTSGQLDNYIAFWTLLDPENKPRETVKGYKKTMLNQWIGYQILAGRADDALKASLKDTYESQYEQIKNRITQQNGGADFDGLLGEVNLTPDDIRHYIETVVTAQKVVESQITDVRLKDLYDYEIKFRTGQFTTASVRHILIGLTDSKGNARTKEDAKKRADDVLAKLKDGGDFAALAKEYSDDPGSSANGGLYENAPVQEWVLPFKNAVLDQEPGKLSRPVETEFGYHIIRVESRNTLTFEQAKDQIKRQAVFNQLDQFNKVELPGLIQSTNIPD
nr:peptidylprolyl isomerase [Paenibacillus hamazuiensis]